MAPLTYNLLTAKAQIFGQKRIKDHIDLLAPVKSGQEGLTPIMESRNGDKRKDTRTAHGDPRVFFNVTSPSSTFICGSQDSGKSHTLSCMLENCLIPSKSGCLERPLTALIFHYDAFISDTMGSLCEAAYLSSNHNVKYKYSWLKNVEVEPLQVDESDLNTQRILDLMAASQGDGPMPLYMHTVLRILRKLRIQQQATGMGFNYEEFKSRLLNYNLTIAQTEPLKQRLDTLESFLSKPQIGLSGHGKKSKKMVERRGSVWDPVYMNSSAEASAFTNTLLSVVRLQRDLGVRVIISTQEPAISTALLNLCFVTVVHRFTSPEWLRFLRHHLAGAVDNCFALTPGSENELGDCTEKGEAEPLLTKIVRLGVGQALLFAPTVTVRTTVADDGKMTIHQLGAKHLTIKVRARLTDDGGKSVLSM
ncbi:hypothetical protein N8T08_008482 [Aspergillus melleus]|uniref:Uncharacterized protein n=1 Tax=Aspergillus melleus TaxID=138277 RepID=A0ACC3AVF5_9EURO|nr:hypothetical protein N8T08_008482 [Aspergillus melleus]